MRGCGKRKVCLIENNMTRDDDPIARAIKTPVPFMMRGVSEKHTEGRPRGKLMRCGGGCVGIARATKNAEVVVHRRSAKKGKVRCREVKCFGWENVQQVCRRV